MAEKCVSVESPDNSVKVDFLGAGKSKKKKDRRACSVKISVEDGKLFVQAFGCDDRSTILCDMAFDIPEEDTRR